MKLRKKLLITCPKCWADGRPSEEKSAGCFEVIEIHKTYKFECSVCGCKCEYILNLMPKMTIIKESGEL